MGFVMQTYYRQTVGYLPQQYPPDGDALEFADCIWAIPFETEVRLGVG